MPRKRNFENDPMIEFVPVKQKIESLLVNASKKESYYTNENSSRGLMMTNRS